MADVEDITDQARSVKRCFRCEKLRPRSMFSPDRARKDGLHFYCKPCIAELQRLRGKQEKVRERDRAWKRAHPYYGKARQAKRRSKVGGTWTIADIMRLLELQRHKCAHTFCRASLKGGYHIDHIMPLALGGSNAPSNLQLLCAPCNLSKSARHPIDFAQMKGLLL